MKRGKREDIKMSFFKKHIFICTNLKKEGRCCGKGSLPHEFIKELKDKIRTANLTGQGGIRVSSSGCMGRCEEGPIAVVYPEAEWFNIQDSQERQKIQDIIGV